jgi:CHAD domain-containing protein
MTPEQIKKHEPMNINNLYEAVPCKNFENILESDYHVQLEENRRDESIKLAADKYLTESYRPVTRESIEAFLREFGEAYGKDVLQSISDTFLKPDNLAKASFNDQPAIQAMGETIVNFPMPDITELINKTLGQ